MPNSKAYQKIWQVVALVPKGKVATYGQIARLAGFGRNARIVGYALHHTPDELEIPWHRIVNARGKISLPVVNGKYDLQHQLLEREGIVFKNHNINLNQFQWNGELPPESH